jgi:AraC-like DNA-binding protein
MSAIRQLLDQAAGAASFHGETLKKAGEMLKIIPEMQPFRQLIQLLDTLQLLAESTEARFLNQVQITGEQEFRGQARMKRIEEFMTTHYSEPFSMAEVTGSVNLSEAAFCRWFKKTNGVTFTEYVNGYGCLLLQRIWQSFTFQQDIQKAYRTEPAGIQANKRSRKINFRLRLIIQAFFLSSALRAALATSFDERPYFSSSSSGLPLSPNESFTATNSTGTGSL